MDVCGDAVTSTLAWWLYRIEAILLGFGVFATFAMMCLTTADALSRYALNSPILGALELTEKYLMVAAIFLGLSYAYRGGLFIRVTLLVDRLPAPGTAGRRFDFATRHAGILSFCSGSHGPPGVARTERRHAAQHAADQ